jgi:hypothetical protein
MRIASVAVALSLIGAAMVRGDEPSVVPPVLKGNFKSFTTPAPATREAAEKRKVEVRGTLWKLFGDLPPVFTPKVVVDWTEPRPKDGYTIEHFTFDNGLGDTVYGYTLIPTPRNGHTGRGPAILYHHYHGGAYTNGKDEVLNRSAFAKYGGLDFTPGERLAQMGYIVVAIDAYAFGERRWQGPAGAAQEGRDTEWALSKTFLWEGRVLWGAMVRDDLLALNYLCSRPDVDDQRVAAMGLSMGSTRSWWLAAMDDRVKATVSVSCLTRYQNLIAHGGVNQHGFYYFVPGMLQHGIDAESVVACIAPRAHLTMTGDEDAGSPVDGARAINDYAAKVYNVYGAPDNFRGLIFEHTGHVWSPAMFEETVQWVPKHIGDPRNSRK